MENKFLDEPDATHHDESLSPIYGYQDQRIVTLEEAVQNITHVLPKVINYFTQALLHCNKTSKLTEDESAAIYLYTMANEFFSTLNRHLRAMDRQALRPWFCYLKLFITALNKLPSFKGIVWRGVRDRINFTLGDDASQTWWAVTSTSKDLKVIEPFLGETGTFYTIETINGRDISQYSANLDEQEVILMPGTRICLTTEPLEVNNRPFMLSFKECTSIPQGKHVMFSHAVSDETIVSQILQVLRDRSIPIWFDKDRGRSDNIYDSLAVGVENAAFVCCFVSPEYEKSPRCQIELQYAYQHHKKIIPCLIRAEENWEPIGWLKTIVPGVEFIDFRHLSNSDSQSKANSLIWKLQNLQYAPQDDSERPNILFELIKYDYICNSSIERFMNPAISYPIEQSYINLAIVETKPHQEKEEKLRDTRNTDAVMGAFEEIYGTKTPICVKDIFKTCKNQTRQVLVFGRAGIGKSTLCRYIAYQWATGAIWPEYELVVLIPLRYLTEQGYQADIDYYHIDILKKHYFSNLRLSDEDEKLLEEQIRKSRILWLLDGYDEIVHNKLTHLQRLIANLLKTSDHIVTSRPYLTNLSYSVQMEITGFTDKNIPNYVEQFFHQLENEAQNSSIEHDKLLSFLKLNPRIWGIAHIPINLELICSLWSNTNWSEMKTMTMTMLYNKLTEWVCRRYLDKQKRIPANTIDLMDNEEVYQNCDKELAFLETLAFRGMESNAIILRSALLKDAKNESNFSLTDYPHLLNIGLLKSLTHHYGTGTRIEADKDQYFVHLSFQEYFAARYLVTALNGSKPHKMIEFIHRHKYNRRFQLMLTFASGLLAKISNTKCIDTFWDTILAEPLDKVGIRHMEIVISCMEETHQNKNFTHWNELMEYIIQSVECAVYSEHNAIRTYLTNALRRSPSIVNENKIIETFTTLLQIDRKDTKKNSIFLISELPIFNPQLQLIQLLLTTLEDANDNVRSDTCKALGRIGEKAATKDVIAALVTTLGDVHLYVRARASVALGEMGEKAAKKDVIAALVTALDDANDHVRSGACGALGGMGEEAATTDVIAALVTALGDANDHVRKMACVALGEMGEKAATKDVIAALVTVLGDANDDVKWGACGALGRMGEKAATKDVIAALVTVLGDANDYVRSGACEALGRMGEKAATKDVIAALVTVLGDANDDVKWGACGALGRMGEKAATKDVIPALVTALRDENDAVKSGACQALGRMGEKEATKDVIAALLTALGNANYNVRREACEIFGRMGEKAATKDVIAALVTVQGDANHHVRSRACQALGRIGEKAATKDVIAALVTALGNANDDVRWGACEALGGMGEKAATKDVIAALVTVLGNANDHVKFRAYQALGRMGEKAATKDVIAALVTVLGDANDDVKFRACEALGRIGEKAATKDVIAALVTALGNANDGVRWGACEALGGMGEKAATKDVIAALVTVLGDANDHVKFMACEALGRMGEKAATKDVIAALVAVLGDASDHVKFRACEALGRMGEKAATKDVIAVLVTVLGDANDDIRSGACEALGRMGEKAATKDVIAVLVTVLGDANDDIRSGACEALGRMGEKAATKDVIAALVTALGDANYTVRREACRALGVAGGKAAAEDVIAALVTVLGDANDYVRSGACEVLGGMGAKAAINSVTNGLLCTGNWDGFDSLGKILASASSLSNMDSNTVSKLFDFWNAVGWHLRDVALEKMMMAYIDTKLSEWCPIIGLQSLRTGCAITIVEQTIVVYGNSEPAIMPSCTFCDELGRVFANARGLAFYLYGTTAGKINQREKTLVTLPAYS